MRAQGWYRDPYGLHQDRYFSDGQPTKLVRDGAEESYDPPPPEPPEGELVEVPEVEPTDGSDLRRADEREAQPAFDTKKERRAAFENVETYGPMD